MPRLLLTRKLPELVESDLASRFDLTVNSNDRPMTGDMLADAFENFDAICCAVTDDLGSAVFQKVKNSRRKILANYGVGFSHIDISAARALGITVTNTPDVLSECTADLAITLMLMAARRAGEGERQLRSGNWAGWHPTHMMGQKLSGETLGIIGFGRIGQETARRAHFGFGMKILAHNRRPISGESLATTDARQVKSLDELLKEADVVSLHCPGGQENANLINSDALNKMKPTSILINTARGEIIDDIALIDALKNRQISAAGLDVYRGEPKLNSQYIDLENAVLLPHLGSATKETRLAMGHRVSENLCCFFEGETPRDRVS